jgi:HNH endonuclease
VEAFHTTTPLSYSTIRPMVDPSATARFWKYTDASGGPDACWPWTGTTHHGYGVLMVGGRKGKLEYAHRLSYALHHGALPVGHEGYICHTCDAPACVNPAHLYRGTPKDNQGDAWRRRRHLRLPGWKMGERNGRARLTEADVHAIRASTERPSVVARRYGLSPDYVTVIRQFKAWKHLTIPRDGSI